MQKFFDNTRKVLEAIVFTVFGLIITLTIVQVFMRYMARSPITWYDEFVRFLLIWGTLLGCALATHYKKHIGMDLLLIKLPRKAQAAISAFINIAIIALCVFYVIKGTAIAIDSVGVKLPTTGISKLYYYGAIPVSTIFWAIFSAESIINEFKRGTEDA